MYFDVHDYPKFKEACVEAMLRDGWFHLSWSETFRSMGYSTYRNKVNHQLVFWHWLDDHEFTFFVLRYS